MGTNWRMPTGLHTSAPQLPVEGELPSFDGATGWLNSPPLTPAGLGGKVVLASFWTYTCINWLRQLPYLRAWAGKYSGQGLVVIGVHTPEFGFEHDAGNVRRAVQEMRIDYPERTTSPCSRDRLTSAWWHVTTIRCRRRKKKRSRRS